ncbi:MAG: DNA replication/repair protein RecF [Oscillospiraceae bacterium]|nr:DNA replication/repair protein RecF [Oscillospiraceae bacterium]
MTISSLTLERFRNFQTASVTFSDGVNVITGRNGQGKTNLLEAIYYLASGRAFRTSTDKELINFDAESALIRTEIMSAERKQSLEARFFNGRRREIYANEVKLKKVTELVGRLTAVLFCPDNLSLIKDGAAVRRRLMDNTISQLRPRYLAALIEFTRLYENKTRILRDHYENPSLIELLDDFNIRLAEQSAQLIYYRSGFVENLAKKAAKIHKEFSGGAEEMDISYQTVGGIDPKGKKPEEILPHIIEHQREHYTAELRSGLCLTGAHKDDMDVQINKKAARKYASQGQARTAAVSIKLAERDIHFDDRGEYPVLLLDDVLSELDNNRQEFILGKIEQGQVLVSCCEDVSSSISLPGKVIFVEDGAIK